MNEQAIRFRIGIFVLAGLIALGVLIILFGSRPYFFLPSSTFMIQFDTAQGVSAGTPVRRSGVKIGEVRRVTLDDDTGRVEVSIQITDGYKLHKGDRPTLMQNLLGGDATITFLPPAKKNEAAMEIAESGTVFEGIVQAGPSDVIHPAEEALKAIKKSLENLTPEAEKTLREIRVAVPKTSDAIQDTANKLTPSVEKMLARIDKALPTIENAFDRIDKLGPVAEMTLNEIRDAAKRLTPEAEKTMAEFRKLVPDAQKTLNEVSDAAKTLTPEVKQTMAEFRKLVPDAQKMINELTPEAKQTMAEFRKLVPDAQKTLKEVADAAKKLTPEAEKTMAEVRKSLDEIQVLARNWTKVGERLDVFIRTNEDKLTRSIERTDEVLKRVNDIFGDENQKNVRDTLKNVRVSSDRFDSIARNTDEMIKDSRATLKTLNESMLKVDRVLTDVQKVTKPLAERGDSIMKNVDEVSDKLNRTLTDVRDILKTVVQGQGTVQKLMTDPSLYNNLNEASLSLSCLMPRFEHIMRDIEIFADKLARHPELLGIRGAIAPGSGVKESPQYHVFPYPP